MSISALPNFSIRSSGPIGTAFAERRILDFHAAARHVRDLPYGRTSNRCDYSLVLAEERGTCSTKHALLRELAAEHGQPVRLILGIYEMCEENTPGIGEVLHSRGLEAIPEAHCFLRYADAAIDVTNATSDGNVISEMRHEEEIIPEQIGDYKALVHQRYLSLWAEERNLDIGAAWDVREACIRVLERRCSPFA